MGVRKDTKIRTATTIRRCNAPLALHKSERLMLLDNATRIHIFRPCTPCALQPCTSLKLTCTLLRTGVTSSLCGIIIREKPETSPALVAWATRYVPRWSPDCSAGQGQRCSCIGARNSAGLTPSAELNDGACRSPASYVGTKDAHARCVHEHADALQQRPCTRRKESNRALQLEGTAFTLDQHTVSVKVSYPALAGPQSREDLQGFSAVGTLSQPM